MSINERFFNLLDEKNITQKEFSQKTGIPTQTISGWKNRKTDPPAALISSIADFFHVSCDYILTGSDSYCMNSSAYSNLFLSLSDDDQEEIMEIMKLKIRLHNTRKAFYDISCQSSYIAENITPYQTTRSTQTIPILGYVAAGAPISSYENEISTIIPENPKAAYALIAKGNSMEPVIMNGENIEVISQCELENGEIGIIKLNGEITCKCFYITDNQYELRSLNPDIAPIIVSKESEPELQIVGKVALTSTQQNRYNAL